MTTAHTPLNVQPTVLDLKEGRTRAHPRNFSRRKRQVQNQRSGPLVQAGEVKPKPRRRRRDLRGLRPTCVPQTSPRAAAARSAPYGP